jgi:hypothetical protein
MPAAPASAGVNAKLASTLLHEARRIKYPNKAQLSQQLAVPTVPAEAIHSVSATEAAVPTDSFSPFAPVKVNGISPIDLVAVRTDQVLQCLELLALLSHRVGVDVPLMLTMCISPCTLDVALVNRR